LDWDEDTKLVFKPEGKYSGVVPSYVPHDNEELVEMLEHYKGIIGNEPEFTLQEFIEGACISSEIWCAKGNLLHPTNHTLERKQLMDNDLGPSGGCTGNIVWACMETDCPLCDNLAKLEDFLEETQWTGPIDINTVVTKEGEVFALEFTPRFGYDSFPTYLLGLFEGNFGSFVYESCRGDSMELPLKDGFAAGIRISVPPWPSEDFHARPGIPIRGLRKSDFERWYPYEVGLQNDSLVTSGGWGIIGVAIGWGSGIEEAFEEAYKLANKIRIPDKQYRTDLAEVFLKEYRQISRSFSVQRVNA
jgi:phosphoribosylamine-glycine ligase